MWPLFGLQGVFSAHVWSERSPDFPNEKYVVSAESSLLNCPAILVFEFWSIENESPIALPWGRPFAHSLRPLNQSKLDVVKQEMARLNTHILGISELKWVVVVQFSFASNSLQPHGLQHTRLPCPSLSPGACSTSRPLRWWCHPTISSFVVPFSSCFQSFPATGTFLMSQLFPSGGQSIGWEWSI